MKPILTSRRVYHCVPINVTSTLLIIPRLRILEPEFHIITSSGNELAIFSKKECRGFCHFQKTNAK